MNISETIKAARKEANRTCDLECDELLTGLERSRRERLGESEESKKAFQAHPNVYRITFALTSIGRIPGDYKDSEIIK